MMHRQSSMEQPESLRVIETPDGRSSLDSLRTIFTFTHGPASGGTFSHQKSTPVLRGCFFITYVPANLILNSRSCLASLDTTALHEAVVLAHQQLCFDLLERIEDYTNHDQQGCAAE